MPAIEEKGLASAYNIIQKLVDSAENTAGHTRQLHAQAEEVYIWSELQ